MPNALAIFAQLLHQNWRTEIAAARGNAFELESATRNAAPSVVHAAGAPQYVVVRVQDYAGLWKGGLELASGQDVVKVAMGVVDALDLAAADSRDGELRRRALAPGGDRPGKRGHANRLP